MTGGRRFVKDNGSLREMREKTELTKRGSRVKKSRHN